MADITFVGVGVLVGVPGFGVGVRVGIREGVAVAVGVLMSARCSRASLSILGVIAVVGRSSNFPQYFAAFFRSLRVS